MRNRPRSLNGWQRIWLVLTVLLCLLSVLGWTANLGSGNTSTLTISFLLSLAVPLTVMYLVGKTVAWIAEGFRHPRT